MISRFQSFLRRFTNRVADGEQFIGLSSKAPFSPSDQLLLRQARAREALGDRPVKPVILVEDQPDYGDLELRKPIG